MSNLRSQAEQSRNVARRVQGHHSSKTYNPNQPGIDPWMRDTLLAMQDALNSITETQLAIAEQVDENTSRLRRIEQRNASQ
jgi:hypothetical protein